MAPALAAAIRDADAQAVGKLIEVGADVNARDAEDNTPLILAAFYAGRGCVELLLQKGAGPNAANRSGVTALIRAATDYEKTRLLIAAGAKVGVRTADSWISAAATSWAVLALTYAAPFGTTPGRHAAAPQPSSARTRHGERTIDFARQIKPLLERSCVGCHGGEKPRGLFRVDGREAILRGGASGEAAIVPGRSGESPLIDYVSGKVPEEEMPPMAQRERYPALRADELALLRAWIDQGAEWPKGMSLASPKVKRPR